MKPNVGSFDRLARFLLGCALLGAGYYYQTWWGLLGLVPLATAIFRFCPVYLPLGISSCPLKKTEPEN